MEEGFRSFQEYTEAGLPGCISLVNSVASAEISRISAWTQTDEGVSRIRAAAKASKLADLMGDPEAVLSKGLV